MVVVATAASPNFFELSRSSDLPAAPRPREALVETSEARGGVLSGPPREARGDGVKEGIHGDVLTIVPWCHVNVFELD